MTSTTTLVAPREIADYVGWAARVCGCNPGLARRLAATVTFAEIHYGGAIAVFLGALADGLPDSDFAVAPDHVVSAEVAARGRGVGKLMFEPAVPLTAIASALDDALSRGVHCADLPPTLSADTQLDSLTLSTPSPSDSDLDTVRARRDEVAANAYRQGVAVDAAAWDALCAKGRDFRVREDDLDAAEA